MPIRSVTAYDPYGDGSEDDAEASLAADGSDATSWHTENYFDGVLNKPGVGLLFDLGTDRTVSQVRVLTPVNGFRFDVGVGDSAAEARQAATGPYVAGRDERISVDGTGRFVLVWCTSVVATGDGNRAAISEVEVAGPR
jgi:putative peptidoglycan lipid II flippase